MMKKKILLLLCIAMSLICATLLQAKEKLVVPMIGEWDFDIATAKLEKSSVKTGEIQRVDLNIKCVKSSDGTGNLKVLGHVLRKGYPISFPVYEKPIKVFPAGRVFSMPVQFVPDEPGEYVLQVSIWGGTGYTWKFDTKNIGFRVEWGKGGFRCREKKREGDKKYFIFEFGPQVVNRIAKDRSVADNYARRILWHLLPEGKIPKDKAAIAIAFDILLTTNQLQEVATKYKAQVIFYQRTFNETAWNAALAARTIDSFRSTWRNMKKVGDFATKIHALGNPKLQGYITTFTL